MEHAEAHERLADLALEPARLARLDTDITPDGFAVRRHVAECDACAADLAAYRRTWSELGDVLAARAAGASTPPEDAIDAQLTAPALLRSRTIEAIRRPAGSTTTEAEAPTTDRAPAPDAVILPVVLGRFRASARIGWLAAAAALIVAIGAGSLAWSQQGALDQARNDGERLASVTTTLDRVLADPVHWVTPLRTADGGPGGMLAWSDTELVVFTSALPRPGPGLTYRCWIERDGMRTPIGVMVFSGDTGFWVGSMSGWTAAFAPGSRFGVSLVSVDAGAGTPVLLGTL
jgi:hypothetical protein